MDENSCEYFVCPTCGISLKEIKEKHSIGCPDCLAFFRDIVVGILKERNFEILYKGEKNEGATFKSESTLSVEKLKLLLERSVEIENYEMAIYFRNKIKELEKI